MSTAVALGEPVPAPAQRAILLDAYAARSCPVKTQHRFDPAVPPAPLLPAGPDDPVAVRREAGHRFRAVVLEELIERCRGRVADLRLLAADGPQVRAGATCRALADGVDVVVGPALPPDPAGHRSGAPDLLVRGEDGPTGPTYHPVLVRRHKIVEPVRPPREGQAPREGQEPREPEAQPYTSLEQPRPPGFARLPGATVRLYTRESDFRQLAHSHRLLQAAGFAAARAWAAVIGSDEVAGGPVLCWTDLAEPRLRTADPETEDGWRRASVLDRYDDAFARRLAIAEAAAAGCAPVVEPVVVGECATCPWWERCRSRLDEQDVSLRIDRGALDRREVEALRALEVGTVPALATADLPALLPTYLPLVAHRSSPEGRLRTAVRRARMLVDGTDFARETSGPVKVPGAQVEVDFDLETAADGRIYLWGFRLESGTDPGPGRYVAFARFADLDEDAETALAVEAMSWLRERVEEGASVAVYHYSGFEVAQIEALAARSGDPVLGWAAAYAREHFVDLLEVVKEHWFGVHGLGLKLIAGHAGFRWRDDDPGGLNSQSWFADAVHAPDAAARERARQRVLDYNEDDVRATAHLRAWLRHG